jgi:hypothetical protein
MIEQSINQSITKIYRTIVNVINVKYQLMIHNNCVHRLIVFHVKPALRVSCFP